MKRRICIPQRRIAESGLSQHTDIVDWAILDYIRDWHFFRGRHSVDRDGVKYTRINYAYMAESMPLIGIKDRNAMSRRIKKLQNLGLLETYHAPENTLYIALTPKCLDIFMPRRDRQDIEQQDEVPQTEFTDIMPDNVDNPSIADKFYVPESPLDDSLPYADMVRRIVNHWNLRASHMGLEKCELNHEIYVCIAFPVRLKKYSEEDYCLAIDRYLSLLRAGQTKPKPLKEVTLAIKKLLNI